MSNRGHSIRCLAWLCRYPDGQENWFIEIWLNIALKTHKSMKQGSQTTVLVYLSGSFLALTWLRGHATMQLLLRDNVILIFA